VGVAKAQLLHSKGGALSKTTNFVSWITFQTNPCRAFGQICFCPPLLFTSDNPIQPAVFVYKNYCRPAFAQISQNAFPLGFSSLWFITVYYLPRPKLNSHSGTSISIHFFKIKKLVGF